MADYFPLLSRAVSALPDSTPDSRRAVYERARKALIGQLRAVQPPMAEADIKTESDALDDAIARIEADIALADLNLLSGGGAETTAPPPPPAPAPTPPPPLSTRPPPPAPPPSAPPAPPPSGPPMPPVLPLPPQQPLRPLPLPEAAKPDAKPEAAQTSAPPAAPAASAAGPEGTVRPQTHVEDDDDGGAPAVAFRAPGAPRVDAPALSREQARPAAPGEAAEGRFDRRIIWLPIVLLLCVAVGALAWKLRVPQEEFARPRSAQTQAERPGSPKVEQRAAGGETGEPAAPQPQSRVRVEPQRPAQQQPAPAPQQPAAAPTSQRAAMLVQASASDPQNILTYVGATVWRIEPSQRPGANDLPALRADVDLPEIRLRLTMTIEKNVDPTFRASHIMTLRFTPDPESRFPAVAELGSPQMRNEAAPAVDPLAGVQAKVIENIFIIALTAEPAFVARNLETMRTRGWFDFPLRIADGRIAKITIEKGAVGDKLIEEALNAWR